MMSSVMFARGSALSTPLARNVVMVIAAALLLGPMLAKALNWSVLSVSSSQVEFRGQAGPFEAVRAPDGTMLPGEPLATVAPGQTFMYVSDICVRAAHLGAYGLIRLRRVSDSQVVLARVYAFHPGTRGCGPLTYEITVPADAVSGDHLIERDMVLTPPIRLDGVGGGGAPRKLTFPPIPVTVAPLPTRSALPLPEEGTALAAVPPEAATPEEATAALPSLLTFPAMVPVTSDEPAAETR